VAAFEYQALSADGKSARGVIQADTPRSARARLREKGLFPLDIQAVERTSRAEFSLVSAGRERALILRQLASLLGAGLTLEDVLEVLVEQTGASLQRRRLAAIRARVMEGLSLSAAMSEQPALFPRLYTASVAAGERAGRMETVLSRLADYAEKREAAQRSIGLALIYPLLLAALALAVVWGLLGYVVPRVIEVFATASADLPLPTRVLLTVSDFLGHYSAFIALALGLAVAAAFVAWRRPASRLSIDRGLLRMPLIGALVRARQTAVFTRTLAILSNSAVPLVEALNVAAEAATNQAVRDDIERAAGEVREGQSLSNSLRQSEWLPTIARRLIHGGESSGELAPMLDHAAEIQERDLESATAVLLAVLQPALILLVGLLVLFIVLAIMLPILNVSQLVG